MNRVKENQKTIDNVNYYSDRLPAEEIIALLLVDISKSLAVIADKLSEEKPNDQLS